MKDDPSGAAIDPDVPTATAIDPADPLTWMPKPLPGTKQAGKKQKPTPNGNNPERQPDLMQKEGGPPIGAPRATVIDWAAKLPASELGLFWAALKLRLSFSTIDDVKAAVREARKRIKAEVEAAERKGRIAVRDALQRSQVIPDRHGVIWPAHFTMKPDGLWWQPPTQDNDADPPVWIMGPFKVVAETSDDGGRAHGLLLRWIDRHGKEHQWAMPQDMVHRDGNDIAAELQGAGLSCATPRQAHDLLKQFFAGVRSTERARCVDQSGWHGDVFVLPSGIVIGAKPDSIVLQAERTMQDNAFDIRGTLPEWKSNVAAKAIGNSRLILATSTAFAALLLDITNDQPGGVQLRGDSQTGKTTATYMLASVWGPGDPKAGQVRSWCSTANGMEAVATLFNDMTLALDEIGQADAREAGAMIYMLANQTGKLRMTRSGGTQRTRTFRLLVFSTGEVSLADKISEAGAQSHAGQEVRLLEVPSDAGKGMGVFEVLHGAPGGGAFSDQIREATRRYCGTAGPAFLQRLVAARQDNPDKLLATVNALRERCLSKLDVGNDGQVRSAAMRFALIGAAGELAIEYGVLPWPPGTALNGVKTCFRAWLSERGGAGASEDKRILERLRLFLSLHGASRFDRFDRLPDAPDRAIMNRAGWMRRVVVGTDANQQSIEELEYLILPAVWKGEIFKGIDAKRAAQVILKTGFLTPEGPRHNAQFVTVPGLERIRLYVISSAILGSGSF
jgi:uncharacterized protein (DUF927 family)